MIAAAATKLQVVDAIGNASGEYTRADCAVKTVALLTGSNQKTVKNWFDGTNGPKRDTLVSLCHHSDLVLETMLLFAWRHEPLRARNLVDIREKLREMLDLLKRRAYRHRPFGAPGFLSFQGRRKIGTSPGRPH